MEPPSFVSLAFRLVVSTVALGGDVPLPMNTLWFLHVRSKLSPATDHRHRCAFLGSGHSRAWNSLTLTPRDSTVILV